MNKRTNDDEENLTAEERSRIMTAVASSSPRALRYLIRHAQESLAGREARDAAKEEERAKRQRMSTTEDDEERRTRSRRSDDDGEKKMDARSGKVDIAEARAKRDQAMARAHIGTPPDARRDVPTTTTRLDGKADIAEARKRRDEAMARAHQPKGR